MNLFSEYRILILALLKNLHKKKVIIVDKKLSGLTVELPPRNQNADLSCNAALILSKHNNLPPIDIANILKVELLKNFKEFDQISIAKPGFLNINFKTSFWEKYLYKLIKLGPTFGSNKFAKKKLIINEGDVVFFNFCLYMKVVLIEAMKLDGV